MASTEAVINWFRARQGRVTYSMTNRLGPNSYDCSSAVYFALIEAGFLAGGTSIGNTESLYKLEGSLLQPITRSEAKRGDIFVSGTKGASGGANGHTGVFLSNGQIIHCTYPLNGIGETAASGWMGGPPTFCYRLKGGTVNPGTKNGIAIDNISYDQAKTMVAWIQTKYCWTLLRDQVKARKQNDGRYTMVITCNPTNKKLNEATARTQQELRTYQPGYMQQNIAIVNGDKTISYIECRNLTKAQADQMVPHLRNFLKDILLSDQTYGYSNAYGTWDVRVKGEGFNDVDTPIVRNEIEARVKQTGANAFAVKAFKY